MTTTTLILYPSIIALTAVGNLAVMILLLYLYVSVTLHLEKVERKWLDLLFALLISFACAGASYYLAGPAGLLGSVTAAFIVRSDWSARGVAAALAQKKKATTHLSGKGEKLDHTPRSK